MPDLLLAAADGSHTSGCMIALMPAPEDADRLAVPGGETAGDLHCTLFYLGGDASAWSPEQRADLVQGLRESFDGMPPVPALVFGVAHWNGDGEEPSWVWSVGDDNERDGQTLEGAHLGAVLALETMHDQPELAPQHTPWAAHVCAQYTDDQSMVPEMEKRLGPVVFDRVRVSFGSDDTDIPLDGSTAGMPDDAHPESSSVTASGAPVLRRGVNATELASCCDFAAHQAGWQSAVDMAVHDWGAVASAWRTEIRHQLLRDDTAADLADLSVSTARGASLLYARMEHAAMAAGRAQQREAEQQGVQVPAWDLGADALTAALSGRRLLRSVADVTSDLLGSRMVQAAKQRARALFGVHSGIRLASEVDSTLKAMSDAWTREQLGAAVTAAQAAGRMAVLEAAPRATYYSSEILDKNTCGPCRRIDGKAFSSLADADAAYPAGVYEDCSGGDRCRGTVYAVWDRGLTAGAEETVSAQTEPLGGRPNKGTKRDKRLHENDPAHAAAHCTPQGEAHFGSSQSKATGPWDGAASRFSDAQYKTSCAACDPGDGTVKDRCFEPHHEPGGALNVNGLHAAASRLSTLKGHSPDAVATAKAHLRAHYKAIGEDVPPSLTAAGMAQCPDGWVPDDDGDGCVPADWTPGDGPPPCPPGMVRDPDSDGCVMAASAATAQLAAQPVVSAVPDSAQMVPWTGVLAPEGKMSGDGREFSKGALTWRDLPVPLRWNRVDSHGGEARTEAVNVGRIDTITRVGDEIQATGMIDLSTPDGQTAHNKIQNKSLRGVSIDADSITDAQVEYVWPDAGDDGEEMDFLDLLFGAAPEKTIYHAGRISAATLCDIPAFAEAYIALVDDAGALVAGGAMDPAEWAAAQQEQHALTAAAHRAALAARAGWTPPPADWFADPGLSVLTPITVDGDRVYGHAGDWNSPHIGFAGKQVFMPREEYHDHFMTGALETAEGTTVSVGQITVHTGHADIRDSRQVAAGHYDNTGFAVADVCVGNDAHGIWVAGAIRPHADPLAVMELRASGQVSGDWRSIGGRLRMVGLLGVNVGGFGVPKPRALMASGEVVALVAAGMLTMAPGLSRSEREQLALRREMDALAQRFEGE